MQSEKIKNTCWLIGHPVKHSLSPVLHSMIYKYMDCTDWKYKKKDIKDLPGLDKFTSKIKEKGHIGFNVTVPYKEEIMNFIDSVDKSAKVIGAVNTVVNNGDILKGYNTDWSGFCQDLKKSFKTKTFKDVLVFGCGGAGRAVIYALAKSMATGNIYIHDRDNNRAVRLKEEFKQLNSIYLIKDFKKAEEKVSSVGLFVNATPVGMHPGPAVLNLKNAASELKIYDVVYNRKTELIREAQKKDIEAVNGAGMLVGQAADAFELWSGQRYGKVSDEVKDKIKDYIRKEVKND